jgi:hypothetical protein
MANGVFMAPRTLTNISTATTDADVEEVVDRLDAAFGDLAAML